MFLHICLGRADTRQLSQPPVGGEWVLPRYIRRPHLLTAILGRDFQYFKNTTPQNSSDRVVYHTVVLGV